MEMRIARIMKVVRDRSGRVMVLFPQRRASDEVRDSGGQPTKWQTYICGPLNGLFTFVQARQKANANQADISTGSGSVEAWITVHSGLHRRTVSDLKPFDGPHLSLEIFKVEDLRATTVEGVSGHRFRAWRISDGGPGGDYFEQAFSMDLELEVAKIDVTGGSIAHGTEFVRLDRGEPNPELFMIPATYKVVAMKVPSQLSWIGKAITPWLRYSECENYDLVYQVHEDFTMPAIKESPAVLFGSRDQVIAQIKRGGASRVIAVSVCNDQEEVNLRKYLAEALRLMAQVRHGKVERTRERWFRAYAEDLAENTPLSEGLQIEAEMAARAQARIVKSHQFLRAADISKLAAGSVKNPSGALNRWKQKRQIFAIEMKGIDYYPIYALSPEDGYKPYAEMSEILEVLREKTPWGLAFWFESSNGYLGGRAPRELMKSDRRAVLAAAKNEAVGIQHG
jgi:hypothetical protein